MREWNSYSDDITIDGNEVKEYTIRFKTTEYEVYRRIEKFFQRLIDESNCSEKPNNCEVKNYCDDCLYTDTCDSKAFFYACTSKATISKMEQVDKDTNVRSKDCETCKWGEWYRKGYDITMMDDECGGCCSWNNKWTPKTEPQIVSLTSAHISGDIYHKVEDEPHIDKSIGCSRCEGRYDCPDRDMPHAVHCNNYGKITDEPQTDCAWGKGE